MRDKNLILIVDDMPKNLQLLASILYKRDFEISMADRGKTALEIMRDNPPDLVLLDIMMPEMDGFEVLETMKNEDDLKEIPVIFLTAKNDQESIIKSFNVGASDYVTKPFNSNELLSRVNTHLSLYNQKKELKYFNNHLEDLVEKKTRQIQDANQRLSKLDEAKSYFISLLSHELRTPVTGIKGFANLMINKVDDPDLKDYCDMVLESVQRLERFTDLSLLLTKLKTEKYNLELSKENIHGIINESVEKDRERIEENGLQLDKKYCNDSVQLELDSYLVSRVMEILLDNAIKYSSNKGKIIIETSENEEELLVLVKDTGKGFPAKILENKFEMFSSDELMNHQEGFGLGLAASKVIMNYHDGDIDLYNSRSGGAVAELCFKK